MERIFRAVYLPYILFALINTKGGAIDEVERERRKTASKNGQNKESVKLVLKSALPLKIGGSFSIYVILD